MPSPDFATFHMLNYSQCYLHGASSGSGGTLSGIAGIVSAAVHEESIPDIFGGGGWGDPSYTTHCRLPIRLHFFRM